MDEERENSRIESLSQEAALLELCKKVERLYPQKKLEFLTKILSLVETSEKVNGYVALTRLLAFVKSHLIIENLQNQVSMFDEPVLTVEKVLELVHSDRRFLNPLESVDAELLADFINGFLVKANPRKDTKFDKSMREIVEKLTKEVDDFGTDEIEVQPDFFDEMKLPESIRKYFSLVDAMMKYLLITLFEFSKSSFSEGYIGPAKPAYESDVKCEDVSSKWLRDEIHSRLDLIGIQRYNMYVEHETGEVTVHPTLYFRENVIDKKRKTICFLGFISDFVKSEPSLTFDKTYSSKKFYIRNVHDMKAPLIAYLTALKLTCAVSKQFPFNLKIILFPFRIHDEARVKDLLEDNLQFVQNIDYFVLMNGIDHIPSVPCIINSSVGEKTYTLAVYLNKDHRVFREETSDCRERLRMIIFEIMDLLRKYKCFVKERKSMKIVDATDDEFFVDMVFGTTEECHKGLEHQGEWVELGGWRAKVTLKTFTHHKHLTAIITEGDFNTIRRRMRSKDPLLKYCRFEFFFEHSCHQWTVKDEYHDEIGPILRLALLRGTDKSNIDIARSNSALAIPVVIQKLLKKETMAVSFSGIEKSGHHAMSFTQAREAVKIIVALIDGLKLDGKPLTNEEINSRTIDIFDLTAVVQIPIKTHLEAPFYDDHPEFKMIFERFLEGLLPKKKPPPSYITIEPPQEAEFKEAGMVAKYFSNEKNTLVIIKYTYLDKINQQRKYLEEAKSIVRKKSVLKERDIALRMVSFLVYLFFKKRRSDVICRHCKVYERRFPNEPFLSPLGKGLDVEEYKTSLVSNRSDPPWIPLSGSEDEYRLVDTEGFINFTGFIKLVKDLIFNIVFDGDSSSPVEGLYRMILREERQIQNNAMVNAIAGKMFRTSNLFDLDSSEHIDTGVYKYASYFKMIPKISYSLEKIFNCNYVDDLVSIDEIKNYVILDSIHKFIMKNRFGQRISPVSSCSFISLGRIRSMTSNYEEHNQEEEVDEKIYKMIDRTLIDKLLKDELVVLPPPRPSMMAAQEDRVPYACPKNWTIIYSYLMKKTKDVMATHNQLWDLYKKKLHALRPGTPIGWVFSSDTNKETFTEESISHLKRYIKFSITIVEHLVRLHYHLQDISLLYSVKPKFIKYEAYYIMRNSLPIPSTPPFPSSDLILYAKTLKKNKVLTAAIDKDKGKIRKVRSQGISGSPTSKSSRVTQHSEVTSRKNEKALSTHFDEEKLKKVQEINSFAHASRTYKKVIEQRKVVVRYLTETKGSWRIHKANLLKQFEDILLLNIRCTEFPPGMDTLNKYKLCIKTYDKVLNILKGVKECKLEHPKIVELTNLKNYRLKQKETSILYYLKKYIDKNETIYCYLDKQGSEYCRRPVEYYKRVAGCYIAIYNLIKTVRRLQDMFYEIISPDCMRTVRFLFPSLINASNLILVIL